MDANGVQFTAIPNKVIGMWSKIGRDAFDLFVYFQYCQGRGIDYLGVSYDIIQEVTGLSRAKILTAFAILERNGLIERRK